MSLTKYPNGISSFGLPVIGGRFTSTGRVFFVNSNTGSNSYNGRDKDHPKDTIANALAVATSERGDVIYVMPGHAETLSTTVACQVQKSCIKLIGLGHGANRPQLTFGSSGSISIESDNFTMENFLLLGGDTAIKPIAIKAKHCTLRALEWRDSTATSGSYNILEATSGNAGLLIDKFKYMATTGVAIAGPIIRLKASSTGGSEYCELNNVMVFAHNCAVAGDGIIHCDSSSPPVGLLIKNTISIWHGSSTDAVGPYCLGSTTKAVVGMLYRAHAGSGKDTDEGFILASSSDWEDQGVMSVGVFDSFIATAIGEAGYLGGCTTVASTA